MRLFMAMKLRQRWLTLSVLFLLMWICSLLLSIRYGMTHHDHTGDRFRLRNLESLNDNSDLNRTLKLLTEQPDGKAAHIQGLLRAGLPNESTIYIVPRDRPKYDYLPVKNRNKFEALFRDFPSLNKLPDILKEEDQLNLFDAPDNHTAPLERFHKGINRYELYSYNNSDVIESLLNYLRESPLTKTKAKSGGTQVKLFLSFKDGGSAIMKPWRVPREYETLPDHYYFADIERHTAEIAAFHLDRILDFRRVVPVSGRIFNLTSEIRPVAIKSLNKTFFYSPANNLCFMTTCDQYCGISRTPVCGKPDSIEGSVIAFLPMQGYAERNSMTHPFKRSYSKRAKAEWEDDKLYCKRVVMTQDPYKSGRRLLDIVDLAIFDFFMGNMDRHSYHTFKPFRNFTSLIHFDHGRGFGRYQTDELSCLVPLMQCCIVRNSTYERLLILQREEYKLGDVMRESMSTDMIAPVLYEPHYAALDRRLRIVLEQIHKCVARATSPEEVLKPEPRIEDFVEDPEDPSEGDYVDVDLNKQLGGH